MRNHVHTFRSSISARLHAGARALGVLLTLALAVLAAVPATTAAQPPTPDPRGDLLWKSGLQGFRANIEWRSSFYGAEDTGGRRRTLFRIFAQQGEFILTGSSAIGVNQGDVRIYNPGTITGRIGDEVIPALAGTPAAGVYTNGFSCAQQRTALGNDNQGRITNRAQELAGPDAITAVGGATAAGVVANGYVPCYYQAPATGIYFVIFVGPAGFTSDADIPPAGEIEDGSATKYNAQQGASVAVWDATVRSSLTPVAGAAAPNQAGRLFSYYFSMNSGANGRPLYPAVFVVSPDGYQFRMDLRGIDPFGFILSSNGEGFLDDEGRPLYRDILASPNAANQNQLTTVQGGARLNRPVFPLFISQPDALTLGALNIPAAPVAPAITNIAFRGNITGNISLLGTGGTFTFESNGAGYELVISRDGQDFTPTKPENRLLAAGATTAGPVTVEWDGKDNAGNFFPQNYPGGPPYVVRITARGGEVHFPMVDVENSTQGGPTVTLLNPPGGQCNRGLCTLAFYDDRGYLMTNGTLIGTAINGPLCAGNPGNPPAILDGTAGFDSSSAQRAFGFATGGNASRICAANGGFGDTKGLDLWTFFEGGEDETELFIASTPDAIELSSFTARRSGRSVIVEWTTSMEQDTLGFHLYRSEDGSLASAVRVTPELIVATGRGQGASYRWKDRTASPTASYTYWLQETETSGKTNWAGSVTVGPATGSGG